MADGFIRFSVDLSISDAEKELDRLRKKALKLEDSINTLKFKRDALADSLKEARTELEALEKKTSIRSGQQISLADVEKANQLRASIAEMEKEVKKYDSAIRDSNADLDATVSRYAQLRGVADQLRQSEAQPDTRVEDQLSGMERARALAQEALTSLKNGFIGLAQLAGSGVVNAVKSIGSAIKKAFSGGVIAVGNFGKGLLGAVKNLNVFGKLSEGLGSKLHRLGGMIRRVFVFSVITKGLRAIRSAFSTMLAQNTELSASLARLKGVLLTAFQPIYDVIVPALTALINVLTRALAVVAQFIATLFGRTVKSAQAGAKALNAEAGAISGTGEAAEKAAGSLAGFDEINTITTENAGGVGGGGGGASTAPLFDYEFEDQPPFDSWGEAFSAFLDNILAGIPRLREAFTQFAANLNDFTGKLLEMFTFPGVKEKVVLLGQELAEAFNELVANINWYQLGQALGAGLNLALLFLVNFIYTFDWLSLGSSLAASFNGLVSQIDWYAFGELLWGGFKIGIETLAGFILGLDMAQLAAAAGNLAIGFFNSVSETIANIDWYQIGQQVADFIANVDWNGVADSMFSAIGAALGGIAEFIAGLFNDAMANISDFFNENIEAAGGDVVAGILAGIVNGLINIGKWIGEHVFQPFIDGFKRVFGIHSPSTVMDEQGHLLMDGLKQGVTERIAAVIATFTGLWEKIKGVFSNISNWFKDKFSAAWQAVKDVFSTGGKIFDGIKDGILDGLKAVVNAIINGINKVIAVPFNGINSALKKIRSINILGLRPFSFINTISVPQIPRLAQGAVIPPNREFMAVLGDQKSGNNIEAPEDLIRKIVREENGNAEMIALLRQILSATKARQKMYVNQRVLAETARDGINAMTRTSGRSVLLY